MKRIYITYSVTLLCLLLAVPVFGQISNRLEIGARPLGMGGAFSAIANDANAIYWNPAGIATLQRQEITTMFSDPYGLGINESYLGYILPLTDNMALGVDWLHFGLDDSDLNFSQDFFNASYAYRLPWWNISLGTNVKFLKMDTKLDGTSFGNPTGFGFDFGILASPFEKFRFALTGNDLGDTSVRYETEKDEAILFQKFKIGAAYLPYRGLTIAADLDDRFHLGTEYWYNGLVAFRGGIQKELDEIDGFNRSLITSLGFSAKWKFLQFDYAIENDPDLPVTHRFGISFFYNPSLVSIKDASIKPIPMFRSLYRKYSEEEFAEIVLKNSSQEKLPVTVRIEIPTVTSQPYEEQLILDPQSTKAYPLGISLSNEILQARGAAYDNLVQPVLTVSYNYDNQVKQTSRNLAPLYVLGKNKISWSVPERVTTFITPEDEAVDNFARSVIQQYNTELVQTFNNSNIGKAAVLFDALGKHGIVYAPDRQTPWYLIAADSSIFDNIQFPTELLSSRIGDCDDCTVLYASLLENLGIETVLLDVDAPGEGHIYLMFDSGIPLDQLPSQPLTEREYVIYNNKAWIPVETTMYGHSFAAAWRNGSEEYHLRKSQGYIHEIDVTTAKVAFKAGQPSSQPVTLPTKAEIDELVNVDIDAYDTRLEQFALSTGASMDDPDGVYDAGAAYLRFNRLDQALSMFERALTLRPNFGDALNAIGVIYVKRADYVQALNYFSRASEQLPTDAGIRMNVAITLYMQGKRAEAEEEYGRAIEMDKAFKDLLKFIIPRKKDG